MQAYNVTPEVEKMSKLNFVGNIIPHEWYKHILSDISKKPYHVAITLLADIVYWYRPTTTRCEATGDIYSIKKKFKHDFLRRQTREFAAFFGYSHRQTSNALLYLEKNGYIKRHIREIETVGSYGSTSILANQQFIQLIPEKLEEIQKKSRGSNKFPPPEKQNTRGVHEKLRHKENTTNTTKEKKHICQDLPLEAGNAFDQDRVIAAASQRVDASAQKSRDERKAEETGPIVLSDVIEIQPESENKNFTITAEEEEAIFNEEAEKELCHVKKDELGHEEFKPIVKGKLKEGVDALNFEQKQSFKLLCNVPPAHSLDSRFNPVAALNIAKSVSLTDIRKGILFYQQKLDSPIKPKSSAAMITHFISKRLEPMPKHYEFNKLFWEENKEMFPMGSYEEYQKHVIIKSIDRELSFSMSNQIFVSQFHRTLDIYKEYAKQTR